MIAGYNFQLNVLSFAIPADVLGASRLHFFSWRYSNLAIDFSSEIDNLSSIFLLLLRAISAAESVVIEGQSAGNRRRAVALLIQLALAMAKRCRK